MSINFVKRGRESLTIRGQQSAPAEPSIGCTVDRARAARVIGAD
jgi:hypothetical protein